MTSHLTQINSHPIQASNAICEWKQRYLSVKTFIVGDMFCSLDLEDGYVIGTSISDVTNLR